MAATIKALYAGKASSAATTVYSVPAGKYAVIKSIVIVNTTANLYRTFRLIVGGAYIAYDHSLQGSQTLVINDLDIPLMAGETIQVQGSGGSEVEFTISGFEEDYVAIDYDYSKRTALFTTSGNFSGFGYNYLIKSIVICNTTNVDAKVTIDIDSTRKLMVEQSVIANDTLIIPNPDIFLPTKTLSIGVVTTAAVQVSIVLERVV
ncbi:hypothetical protein MHB43_06620 [Paenibacillus sp. FSL H8-0317]